MADQCEIKTDCFIKVIELAAFIKTPLSIRTYDIVFVHISEYVSQSCQSDLLEPRLMLLESD